MFGIDSAAEITASGGRLRKFSDGLREILLIERTEKAITFMSSFFRKAVTEQDVLRALTLVKPSGLEQDIVTSGFVRNLKIDGSAVSFDILVSAAARLLKDKIREAAQQAVIQLPNVSDALVNVTVEQPLASPPQAMAQERAGISGVRHIIVVGSGKGGVGKSTVCVNLAVAIAQSGARVGLLDADIYGPSIPTLMGVKEDLGMTRDHRIAPHTAHGVRFVSMGYFAPGDKPMIWRGPMAHKAVQEQLFRVDWGMLDYLLIDLPPGTGDVHLTLAQAVAVTGAVIVSTPQDIGLMISMKTLRMFQTTNVPILGLVENMSYYKCACCGNREEIFGHGAVLEAAQKLGIPFLGEIPIDTRIRVRSDSGMPIVEADPESPPAKAYQHMASLLIAAINRPEAAVGSPRPNQPVEIKKLGETELLITWSDNHISHYPMAYLREQCPCAACVDEWTREKRLAPGSIPHTIQIKRMDHVGQYAVRFAWSDGHDTGIYSFEHLRQLCPCEKCMPEGIPDHVRVVPP